MFQGVFVWLSVFMITPKVKTGSYEGYVTVKGRKELKKKLDHILDTEKLLFSQSPGFQCTFNDLLSYHCDITLRGMARCS